MAEAIIRTLLIGRSSFSVSTDGKAMDVAVTEFIKWVSKAGKDIETAITEFAFGTGYEDALKREIYLRLGMHPLTDEAHLPALISL